RMDIGVHLAVAAFLMDEGSVSVDDVYRGRAATLGRPRAASPRDLLCGLTGDLSAIEDVCRGLAGDDEFRGQRCLRDHALRQVETRDRRIAPIGCGSRRQVLYQRRL